MIRPVFTGIIEATGTIEARTADSLRISRPGAFTDIRIGSSICVSGACLSVVEFNGEHMTFDVVPETWEKTKLGSLQAGDCVNLERALSAQGRFEGHIVQGHIEGTAEVIGISEQQVLTLRLPKAMVRFVIPKGSIAIDGVSLTVAAVDGGLCSVALIPHTVEKTTLGNLQIGDKVNIETDILIRALHHEK